MFRRVSNSYEAVGCLLAAGVLVGMTPILKAQDAIVPGAPITAAPGDAPAAATGDAAPPASMPAQKGIDLEFKDIEISTILETISKAFNIPIVIQSDVVGKIKYLNLVGATPEEAIRKVTGYGKLQFAKEADGTYVVGQTVAGADNAAPRSGNSGIPAPWAPPAAPGFGASGFGAPAAPAAPVTPSIYQPGSTLAAPAQSTPAFLPNGLLAGDSQESEPQVEVHYVRVRNVRPGLLAWWLDPYHNEMPIEIVKTRQANTDFLDRKHPATLALNSREQALKNGVYDAFTGDTPYLNPYVNPYTVNNSTLFGEPGSLNGLPTYAQPGTQTLTNFQFGGRQNRRQTGRQGGLGGAGIIDLRTSGVEQIVAIDPQNALLVRATPEGLAKLEEIIAYLDQPLRQVEIEAQFIDVSTDDLKDFGIDFSSSNGPFTASGTGFAPSPSPETAGTFQLGFVKNNFKATLAALVRDNRAKVVNAPRVTAINNLSASLTISTSTPLVLTDTQTGIGGQVGQSQNLLYINTNIGLSVTPTINNDDTITVFLQPQIELQTPPPPGVQAPSISRQSIETVANVRDGDTIALGGLRTKTISVANRRIPVLSSIPLIGKLFTRTTDTELERELIIFLTARIVRRADDALVPGT